MNVHLGNQAELSALGQLAFADGVEQDGTLVNLIVDGGIEMGVGLAGGAVHYGSDLAELTWPAGQAGDTLRGRFAWSSLKPRVEQALGGEPTTTAHEAEPPWHSYLRLKDAAVRGNTAADALIDELARDLAPVVAWLVASVRPTQVSLGGRLSDLGEAFLDRLRRHAAAHVPVEQLDAVTLSLAYSDQLGAMGAVALVVQAELELLSS